MRRIALSALLIASLPALGTRDTGVRAAPLDLLLTIENPEPATEPDADSFGSRLTSIRRDSTDPRGGWDIVIGAVTDIVHGISGAGSAYFYDGDTGSLLLAIPNPAPLPHAFCAAAIGAVDRPAEDSRGGQDILVGCMRNFVQRSPSVVGSTEPGAAYLYDAARRGTAENADIVFFHPEMPSSSLDLEHYGAQVLGVGDKIVIGSMFGNYRNPDATGRVGYGANVTPNTGAVFVLDRNDPTDPYPPVIQDPAPRPLNQFGGNSVQSIAHVPRDPNDPRGPGFDLLISASLYGHDTTSRTGRAYLFDGLTHEKLLTIDNPTGEPQAMFGTAVAAMGTKLVIGAPGASNGRVRAGAVYVFDGLYGAGGVARTTVPLIIIPNPLAGTLINFGSAITALGEDLFVGAPDDFADSDGSGPLSTPAGGAVFVFDGRTDQRGALVATLRNPDPDHPPSAAPYLNDSFGNSLASLGGRVVVGAPRDDARNADDTVVNSAGAVYVYDWDSMAPEVTLIHGNETAVACGARWEDPGATARDQRPLRPGDYIDLTDAIERSGGVDTNVPGVQTLTYHVADQFQNEAHQTRTVQVMVDFTGFLWPVGGADTTGGSYDSPVRTFKSGSVIPMTFQISCGGTPLTSGAHKLEAVHWSSETTSGEPIDATPRDAATTGNLFRLVGDEWRYNLNTNGMAAGVWQLVARLSDGSAHSAFIQLK
jgi:hypothetical protein